MIYHPILSKPQQLSSNIKVQTITNQRPESLELQNLINLDKFNDCINMFGDKDDYLCQICQDILYCPKKCCQCMKNFCDPCINSWLNSRNYCPSCRVYMLNRPNISSDFVHNSLQKLKFSCINSKNGCDQVIPYQDIQDHEKKCQYILDVCNNQGCNERICIKDQQNHRNTCQYQQIICQQCNLVIFRKDLDEHLEKHEQNMTQKEQICQNCQISVENLIEHSKDCIKRPVKCLDCQQKMSFESLIHHFDNCKEIKIKCQFCTSLVQRKHMENHIDFNHCEEQMKFKWDSLKIKQDNLQMKIQQVQQDFYGLKELNQTLQFNNLRKSKSIEAIIN